MSKLLFVSAELGMHTPKLFPGFKAELDELVMYAVHLCVNSVDSCVESLLYAADSHCEALLNPVNFRCEALLHAVDLGVKLVDSCVEPVDAMIEPPTAPKHRRYDCCESGEERHLRNYRFYRHGDHPPILTMKYG